MKFLSTKMHTIIGLIVGVALLAAPWLFGFTDQSQAAFVVPLGVGIFIILNELITTSPLSLIKLVPMRAHIVLDVLTGLFLALSPFLFMFTSDTLNAWLPHIVAGILIVGYALLTNTNDETALVVSK